MAEPVSSTATSATLATIAGLVAKWMPIEASPGVGALIAAALAVKVLLYLIRLADDPAKALRTLKGGGQ